MYVGAEVGAEGAQATVGISHFAQDALGDIVFIDLPKVGAKVTAGQQIGEVESTKTTSTIYTPVSGTIAKIMPPQPDPRTGEMVSVEGATPRRVCGVRFIKAMPGSGSELVVEALSGGDGGVPYTDGVVIRTRLLRAPLDGAETEVSDTVDDETIEKTFGRPLTLAKTWKIALDAAAKGEEVIKEVEPGYWIWVGPKEDAGLEQRVKDLVGEDKQKAAFPLAMPSVLAT